MTGPLIIALAIGVIFVATVVRGYSGFGFAMIGVAGISLTAPPDVALLTTHTNRAAPEPPLSELLSVQELLRRISSGATTNVKASPELFGVVIDRTAIDVAHLNELRSLPLSALLFIGGGGTFTRVHSDPFVNW